MISPLAFVDPEAKLGKDVNVHPFAYIDKNVEIGDNCEILPYASIIRGTRMGNNIKVYQGAIIGADPQDFRWKGDETFCYIGDRVIIRENVIINRGITSEGGTRIGDDSIIMAETHIGHDTDIKGRSVLGNGVKIAGDCIIEPCCVLSSASILHCGSHLGEWSMIKGGCRISGNVPPYAIMAHNPVSYYGVNAYILRGHGFTEDQIDDIAKAYRHIYQCGTSLVNALIRIENDVKQGVERDKIIDFIRKSKLSIVATHDHREYE
ncbi:MAG: acyl-ACP--UDP-N-acetylglucosamine O-acyltransferase [Muribaculaceae bacterium]|nr:acyl-ACP--UDP-N-acetylglucosamine O-acyltransferase [Muribaculaceae bacterium]